MAPIILESKTTRGPRLPSRSDEFPDTKRKATDSLDDLAVSKRIKNSHTASPEPEKKLINVVAFPEKVGDRMTGRCCS